MEQAAALIRPRPSSGWQRHLKGAYTIWYRDIVRFSRDRMRIVGALGQPLLFLFVFGTGLMSIKSGGAAIPDFRQFIFPGVLGMTVLFTSVFWAVSIVWDREFGFLKEVMVAPVSRFAVAIGKIAGGATVGLLQGTLILVMAPVVGIMLSLEQVLMLIGLMLLLSAVMTSFGMLIAARQRTMEGFQMLMQFLLMPMFFFSGAFYPLRDVPAWLHVISRLDPVTYAVDPLRQVALRETLSSDQLSAIALHPIAVDVLVMALMGICCLVPAVWLFGKRD